MKYNPINKIIIVFILLIFCDVQIVKSQNSSILFTFINVRENTKLYPLLSDSILLKNNHKTIPFIENKHLGGSLQLKTITAIKNSKKLNCKLELIERNDTLFCKYDIENGADLIKLRVKLGETTLLIDFVNIPRNSHFVINSIPVWPDRKEEYFYNMNVLSSVVYTGSDTLFLGKLSKIYKLNNGGEYVTHNAGFNEPEIKGLFNDEKVILKKYKRPTSCLLNTISAFNQPKFQEIIGDTIYNYSDSAKHYLLSKGKLRTTTYKRRRYSDWEMEYYWQTNTYKNPIGKWVYYYPTGKLFLTCYYKKVKRKDRKNLKFAINKGKWVYRNEDGSILKIERYRNNKRIN